MNVGCDAVGSYFFDNVAVVNIAVVSIAVGSNAVGRISCLQ